MTSDSARATFSGLMAVLITALGLTVNWQYPDVPNEILTAWGAVLMFAARLGEVWYDKRSRKTGP